MAVPKRKVSKARRDSRRASCFKAQTPTLVECPHCKTMIKAHTVCPECGYYQGKEMIAKKASEKEEK